MNHKSDWRAAAPSLSSTGHRYLDLLRRSLTREVYLDQEVKDVDLSAWPVGRDQVLPILQSQNWRLVAHLTDPAIRSDGRDWPPTAETMVGSARLENVLTCACDVIERDVRGDFIEAGVWRGGVTILLRGVLAAYEITDRTVWVADSFEGLPVPDRHRFPADTVDWSDLEPLKVDVASVRANFTRYDLLDAQVRFLEGWFEDTLEAAPIDELALLRLDGHLYQSTMDALVPLYPRLGSGGFVLVDDYGGPKQSRKAVDDYRAAHGIDEIIEEVDLTGVFWRKT